MSRLIPEFSGEAVGFVHFIGWDTKKNRSITSTWFIWTYDSYRSFFDGLVVLVSVFFFIRFTPTYAVHPLRWKIYLTGCFFLKVRRMKCVSTNRRWSHWLGNRPINSTKKGCYSYANARKGFSGEQRVSTRTAPETVDVQFSNTYILSRILRCLCHLWP